MYVYKKWISYPKAYRDVIFAMFLYVKCVKRKSLVLHSEEQSADLEKSIRFKNTNDSKFDVNL